MRRTALDIGPPGDWLDHHALPIGGALFESGGPVRPAARYSALLLEPAATLAWRLGDPGDPFQRLTEFAPAGEAEGALPCPLTAVALGYDLGRAVERLPELSRAEGLLPDLYASRHDAAYVWDRAEGRGWLVARDADAEAAFRAALEGAAGRPPTLGPAVAELDEARYRAAIDAVLERIAAGEIYQANIALRFSADVMPRGDPGPLFRRLHAASPVPFAAYLRPSADTALLSLSPERFLRWDAAGAVETWPIKGTAARAPSPAADAAAAAALRQSAKDAAEHVMIVDLERNDLGRVCRVGSVRAPRVPRLESFASVHHLVTPVSGQLRADVGLPELLRATFPGGSITGAPKVRAMETIEALEPVRRGPYCGAIGYLDARGGGDLNIAIRTAWLARSRLYYSAGGGIVADSTAAAEWAEAQLKAEAFLDAL